jgi:hypothetical protein
MFQPGEEGDGEDGDGQMKLYGSNLHQDAFGPSQ